MSKTHQTGILYVDDENLALKYFSEIFEGRVRVFTAQSPEMGLELFREHQNQIGIVLSDKNMPGMSGIDLLVQIKEINDTPLRILVTAYKDLGEAVEHLNSGLLDSYLTKPWEPEEMLAKIQKKLDLFWIKQQKAQLLKDRSTKFQEMLMAEKVSSIETLSFGFSQQISNSLGAIRSYFDSIPTQLSQELDDTPPKDDFFWSEYYSSISKKIDHIESIFVGLSNCSIPNQLEFNESLNLKSGIKLAQLIGEVGSAETANNPSISYNIRGETEQHIEADPEKLLRLFSHLFRESLLNIGEDSDGKVDVIIEEDTHTDGSPGLSIYFNDNGDLLTTRQKQHLFNPFYLRTDDSTPGSRMLTCYIIAYQHGGFLETNKEKDLQHNSIHLWLPLVNREPTSSQASKNFLDSLG